MLNGYEPPWRTYVIAEAGSCGDGHLDQMLRLITAAAAAKVDAVKFQWTSNAEKMARRRGRAVEDGYDIIYERYLAWSPEWHECLRDHCQSEGVEYWCTVYLPEDVEVVDPYVAGFKIASFEAGDGAFLAQHGRCKKDTRPILISTGMMNDEDLLALYDVCAGAWPKMTPGGGVVGIDERVSLMHCVSSYPAPTAALNLAAMAWLYCTGGDRVGMALGGFSDHSAPSDTWTGALAVMAGARFVEAHVRSEETEGVNPDRSHAMLPHELRDYTQHIRFAETALGAGAPKGVQPCEREMLPYRVRL